MMTDFGPASLLIRRGWELKGSLGVFFVPVNNLLIMIYQPVHHTNRPNEPDYGLYVWSRRTAAALCTCGLISGPHGLSPADSAKSMKNPQMKVKNSFNLLTWSGFRSFPGRAVRKDMFLSLSAGSGRTRGVGGFNWFNLKKKQPKRSAESHQVRSTSSSSSHTSLIVRVREGSTDHSF